MTNLLLLKPVRRRPIVLVPDRLVPVADEDDGHDDHDDEQSSNDDSRDETDAAGVAVAAGGWLVAAYMGISDIRTGKVWL